MACLCKRPPPRFFARQIQRPRALTRESTVFAFVSLAASIADICTFEIQNNNLHAQLLERKL